MEQTLVSYHLKNLFFKNLLIHFIFQIIYHSDSQPKTCQLLDVNFRQLTLQLVLIFRISPAIRPVFLSIFSHYSCGEVPMNLFVKLFLYFSALSLLWINTHWVALALLIVRLLLLGFRWSAIWRYIVAKWRVLFTLSYIFGLRGLNFWLRALNQSISEEVSRLSWREHKLIRNAWLNYLTLASIFVLLFFIDSFDYVLRQLVGIFLVVLLDEGHSFDHFEPLFIGIFNNFLYHVSIPLVLLSLKLAISLGFTQLLLVNIVQDKFGII